MRTIHLTYSVLCAIFFVQTSNLLAQAVEELIYDVTEMANGSVEQARLEAQRQAEGIGPSYRSYQKNERKSFSGEYTPPDLPEDKKGRFVYGLALFADDGCNVTVKGSQIHSRLQQPQHLPDLEKSFHVLPVAVGPGQPIDITVDYSNTIYNEDAQGPGYPDVDGCALFLYLIPVAIAVDANRDGTIHFEAESKDVTSSAAPFRFWINDDNDGSETGSEVIDGSADHIDNRIGSQRDLEDFSRLWLNLEGLQEGIAARTHRIGLKWKNATGSPSVKIYRTAETDGGTRYLTDLSIAASQTSGGFVAAKTTVSGSTAALLPPDTFDRLSKQNPNAYLLFEGVSEGKGELCLTIHKSDGTETGEGPGVWLDLTHSRKMYLRVTTTGIQDDYPEPSHTSDADPPEPTMGWQADPNGPTYDETAQISWQETMQYIVFVHGWNMSYDESQTFAETMFKRLWQRGYKGRFAFMRWPTMDDSFAGFPYTYNASEYRAWKCGESLKQFMDSLPGGYTRNLAAHSMGNIVAGSALLKGMNVANYAMLNAAVPAACYDASGGVPQIETNTPDLDDDSATAALAYKGKLVEVATRPVNFYLPNDSALQAWLINNGNYKPQVYFARPDSDTILFGDHAYKYWSTESVGHKLFLTFEAAQPRYLRRSRRIACLRSQIVHPRCGCGRRCFRFDSE